MAVKKKKKRTMTAKQKAALAKRRGTTTRKKKAAPKKKAARKTAKTSTKKRSAPMAKKKKGTVKKRVRSAARRAKGFLGKAGVGPIIQDAALAVGGGVAAGFLSNKLPIADPRIKAAAPIVGGIGLAMTVGKKNPMVKGVAQGMVILGTVALIKQFAPNVPMLAGEEDDLLLPSDYDMPMLGYDDFEDDDLMGEPVQIGADDSYYSPADL